MSYAKNISSVMSHIFDSTVVARSQGATKRRAVVGQREAKIARYWGIANHSIPTIRLSDHVKIELGFSVTTKPENMNTGPIGKNTPFNGVEAKVIVVDECAAVTESEWCKLNISKHPKTDIYSVKVTYTEDTTFFAKDSGFDTLEAAREAVPALKLQLADKVGRA